MPKRARSEDSAFVSDADRDDTFEALEALLRATEHCDARITFTPDELTQYAEQTINDAQICARVVYCIEELCDCKHGFSIVRALAETTMDIPCVHALVAQWLRDNVIVSMTTSQMHWLMRCTASVSIMCVLLADLRVNPAANNNSVIRWAANNGYIDVVRLLLTDSRVNSADKNNIAIRWAAEQGHTKIVQLLLDDSRGNPAVKHNTVLRVAARTGHIELVRLVIDSPRINFITRDNTAIRLAAGNGHLEVVRLLLDDGHIDPVAHESAALNWAAITGHIEVVRLLLVDRRIDPAAFSNAALRFADYERQKHIVQLLLTDQRVCNALSPELLVHYRQRFGTYNAVE